VLPQFYRRKPLWGCQNLNSCQERLPKMKDEQVLRFVKARRSLALRFEADGQERKIRSADRKCKKDTYGGRIDANTTGGTLGKSGKDDLTRAVVSHGNRKLTINSVIRRTP
jgi:hypothetical protein